jgi:CheY-like chemotaxis protein
MKKSLPPNHGAAVAKRPPVLVIDDDPEILAATQAVLASHGYAPYLSDAANPQIVDDLLRGTFKPRLILLDILLSGKDGREICRELKSKAVTRNIPVIMFSAYPHAADSAYEAGADGFLSKPFGLKELISAVEEFLPPQK